MTRDRGGAVLALWAAPKWDRVKENLELCVNPDARASVTTAWDDSYNNVLIRELLGRARAFGEIELTGEELVRYGTARWYYEDGPGNWNDGRETDLVSGSLERHVEFRMQHLDEPALRDILPQHYMENYRASWWILRYGWVPALALMLLVAALPALALWNMGSIRLPSHTSTLPAVSAAALLNFSSQAPASFPHRLRRSSSSR